jgi:hypothetical protein
MKLKFPFNGGNFHTLYKIEPLAGYAVAGVSNYREA